MGVFSNIISAVGGLLGIGGNLISSDMNYKASKNLASLNHNYILDQMKVQNQYNIDAFNRENAYNSPLAQRQRNLQAGINPNFIDGGTPVASDQSSAVSGSAPGATSSPIDLLNGVAQIANVFAQTKNINADTKLKENQAHQTSIDNEYRRQYNESLIEQVNASKDLSREQVRVLDSKLDVEIQKLNNEINLLKSQNEDVQSQIRERDGLLEARKQLLVSQTRESDSRVSINNREYEWIDKLHESDIQYKKDSIQLGRETNATNRANAITSANASMYGANLSYKAQMASTSVASFLAKHSALKIDAETLSQSIENAYKERGIEVNQHILEATLSKLKAEKHQILDDIINSRSAPWTIAGRWINKTIDWIIGEEKSPYDSSTDRSNPVVHKW